MESSDSMSIQPQDIFAHLLLATHTICSPNQYHIIDGTHQIKPSHLHSHLFHCSIHKQMQTKSRNLDNPVFNVNLKDDFVRQSHEIICWEFSIIATEVPRWDSGAIFLAGPHVVGCKLVD